MKAALIEGHGGPEVLRYGEVPDPEPGPGDIVVDVHAASVNAADWKVRRGDPEVGTKSRFPYILGRDFSGVVAALGKGVTDLAPGDLVFGVCETALEGAYAEKVAIKAAIVARKSANVSHVDAAALGLTGLTALVTVEDTLRLRSGETILIQGGAGGVAGVAIQIAKHLGARVVTTASAANHDYVRGLGADQVIDYNVHDFAAVVSGCDAVFDTVGGDVAQRSFAVLRPGGRAAFIASGATAPTPTRDDVESLRPQVGRDRRHLERILALLEAGAIRPPPITRYPLAEAAAAHAVSEARHLRGKLVLEVR
jgi:NADPH:quinone reductase-like Zn-dependent oxidoreductase